MVDNRDVFGSLVGLLAVDATPVDGDVPFVMDVAKDGVEESGFTNAIGAEDADEIAFVDMEGEVRE